MLEMINLLLIDDNENYLEILQETLNQENYSCRSVGDLHSAQSIVHEFEVDAIVCDHNLIGENGLEFLKKLRKDGLPMPFILISGSVTTKMLQQALRLGAFEVMAKPFSEEHLIQVTRKAVSSGIQYRLMLDRMKETMRPEDFHLAVNNLKVVSMLRAYNYDAETSEEDKKSA